MKQYLIALLVLSFVSCFPSMQTGPDPHSIKFAKADFDEVINYFLTKPDTKEFDNQAAPNDIPKSVIKKMKKIGFLEYRNLGLYQVFFCGYGVVGKGWGFINGRFSQDQIDNPEIINDNNNTLYLSYLGHLEGDWFRFGAG